MMRLMTERKKWWLEWDEDMEAVGEILMPRCGYGCLTGKPRCLYGGLTREPKCDDGHLTGRSRCVYGRLTGKPRCLIPGFADINMKAYSAVVYFVCEQNGMYHVELIKSCGKQELFL